MLIFIALDFLWEGSTFLKSPGSYLVLYYRAMPVALVGSTHWSVLDEKCDKQKSEELLVLLSLDDSCCLTNCDILNAIFN